VLEFVRQAGAVNEFGPTDRRYAEGLELYWQGLYAPAIEKFEEVKRLFPQHSEVDRLIQESQEAISRGDGQPNPVWVGLVGLGVVFVALVVLGAIVLAGAVVVWRGIRAQQRVPSAVGAAPEVGFCDPRSPVQTSRVTTDRLSVVPPPREEPQETPAHTATLGSRTR